MIPAPLTLLGVPQLILPGASCAGAVRFRYRDTWLLLASLVLEPETSSRDHLVVRLGLDRGKDSGRSALRLRVDDLRHGSRSGSGIGLGPDRVHATRDTVALTPDGLETDVQLLRRALVRVGDHDNPETVIAEIEPLAPLLVGRFLEGVDRQGKDDGWLERMRRETDALVSHLWARFGVALRDCGRRVDAHDAFRHAYYRFPDNNDLIGELLETVSDGQGLALGFPAAPLQTLLPKLEQADIQDSPLGVGDKAVLQRAVRERLSQLSKRTVAVLEKMAHLPVALPQATVLSWLDIERSDLERAAGAFTIPLRDNRLELHGEIVQAIRVHCPADRSDAIQSALIRRIEQLWIEGGGNRPFDIPAELAQQILEWVIGQGFPIDNSLLGYIMAFARPFAARLDSQQLARYLELRAGDQTSPMAMVSNLMVTHHIHADRFGDALDWARTFLESGGNPADLDWYHALLAAHHGEEDAVFDTFADQCLACIDATGPGNTANGSHPMGEIHGILAENRLARGMVDDADRHNRFAIDWVVSQPKHRNSLSRLLSQQAHIDKTLGLPLVQVAAAWEKALAAFQSDNNPEGEAECLRELGEIAARHGWTALGRTLVERAIALFESAGKPDSANVAEGTLARVLAASGHCDEARSIVDQCITYWRAKSHARWTAHFEAQRRELEHELNAARH